MITKRLGLLILPFLIIGCSSTPTFTDNTNRSLYLHGTDWRIFLPEDTWEVFNPDDLAGRNFLAMSAHENLAITTGHGWESGNAEQHLQKIADDFVVFEEVTKGELAWEFRAKQDASTALRHFYQRVIPITDSSKFVLVSCSHAIGESEKDCREIVDSVREEKSVD